MKKIGLQLFVSMFVMLFLFQLAAVAQDKPAPSPLGKVYQRVGVTDVEITYSRPNVKGRAIFAEDGLTPLGKLWRTGANAATKISFSTDVKVNGTDVKAGEYAIFSIPGAEEWTLILNSEMEQRGTSKYDEAKDAARFTVKPSEFPFIVETFTIILHNVTDTSTDVGIYWEKTAVSFTVEVEKTWE